MQLHKVPLTLAGILLAATAVGTVGMYNGIQAKENSHFLPFLDDDADGLDNATEVRLGTDPNLANSDNDLMGDLAEIILGTHPNSPNPTGSFPSPQPSARLEAYQAGSSFVLQSFLLRKQKVHKVHFYIAHKNPAQLSNPLAPPIVKRLGSHVYSQFLDRNETLPFPKGGYAVNSMRLVLPVSPLLSYESFAVAVVAELDNGVKVADEVRFTTMNGMLVEWRNGDLKLADFNSLQGGVHGGGASGGLFPADPSAGVPIGENLANQVCVQTVGAVGLVGLGVIYGVQDAECDTLFGAVCLSSCQQSINDTFIGLDLPSLLQ